MKWRARTDESVGVAKLKSTQLLTHSLLTHGLLTPADTFAVSSQPGIRNGESPKVVLDVLRAITLFMVVTVV